MAPLHSDDPETKVRRTWIYAHHNLHNQ